MKEVKFKEIEKVLEYVKKVCPSELGLKERIGTGYCSRGECLQCWCEAFNIE